SHRAAPGSPSTSPGIVCLSYFRSCFICFGRDLWSGIIILPYVSTLCCFRFSLLIFPLPLQDWIWTFPGRFPTFRLFPYGYIRPIHIGYRLNGICWAVLGYSPVRCPARYQDNYWYRPGPPPPYSPILRSVFLPFYIFGVRY